MLFCQEIGVLTNAEISYYQYAHFIFNLADVFTQIVLTFSTLVK